MPTKIPNFDAPDWTPTPEYYHCFHLAMLGNRPSEISQQTNLPQVYIKAFLKSNWCQTQLATYHQRVLDMAQQRAFEPSAKFFSKLEEKIEQLDEMTRSENPSTALRALEIWIAHTIGSPVKRTEVRHEHTLTGMSTAELEFVRAYKRLPTPEERMKLAAPALQLDYVDSTAESDS